MVSVITPDQASQALVERNHALLQERLANLGFTNVTLVPQRAPDVPVCVEHHFAACLAGQDVLFRAYHHYVEPGMGIWRFYLQPAGASTWTKEAHWASELVVTA